MNIHVALRVAARMNSVLMSKGTSACMPLCVWGGIYIMERHPLWCECFRMQSSNSVSLRGLASPFQAALEKAQERVTSEWRQFETEVAKSEEWRQEQQQQKRLLAERGATSASPPAADAEGSSSRTEQLPITRSEPWRLRLQALLTILERETAATESSPMMPREQLLMQLHELEREMGASIEDLRRAVPARIPMSARKLPVGQSQSQPRQEQQPPPAPRAQAPLPQAPPPQTIEGLNEALSRAQQEMCAMAEAHRHTVAALEERVEASEAETLDRMRIVAEAVEAETEARAARAGADAELASVRSKAGARMKELISSNKALSDEVAELREVEELTKSKMAALEASLTAADAAHHRSTRVAKNEAAKQQEDLTYSRALVLRYLELESQHEALFPALASAFRFTPQEVQRIQRAQEQHAQESSLWGRTFAVGSRVAEAAKQALPSARGADA